MREDITSLSLDFFCTENAQNFLFVKGFFKFLLHIFPQTNCSWCQENISSTFKQLQKICKKKNNKHYQTLGNTDQIFAHDKDIKRSDNIEMISGSITAGSSRVVLASYYRPPHRTDSDYLKSTKDDISSLRASAKKSIVIIGGDFNTPDIDWNQLTITGSQYPAKVSQTFLNITSDNSFEQLVDFPTRKNKTLDLILTSHPSYKHRCKPMPSIGNSDHDIVLYDTSIKAYRPKPARRQISLWKKADPSEIRKDLATFSENFCQTDYENMEAMWTDFKSSIQNIIEKRVPTKMTSARHSHPWMNSTIKRAIRRKQRAYRKSKRTNLKRDRDRYKRLQQQVQWEIRKADRQYMQDIVSESYTDKPKRFWSYVKSKGQESIGVAPLKNQDGFLQSDNRSKAEILNHQFSSVFTREDKDNIPSKGPSPYPSMPDIQVTPKGVQKLLKELNPYKATGPDEVPSRILQVGALELAPALVKLYQYSIDTGEVPQDWRDANVVPIFKKGDRHQPSNYRPVSLTSVVCKVLEHIVHSSIMTHFDRWNILCDSQHGFRKRRSCETQLIETIDDIARHLSDGNQVDVILLDFEKAFDKVPHSRLLNKLDFYGVRGKVNNWIKAFLSNRKQQVVLEGAKSSQEDVLSGVPQGTVLGPLLFLAYINDMPGCSDSNVRLFADDSLLYRVIQMPEDSKQLQLDLQALEQWEKEWLMSFNASKCSLIRICPKANDTKETNYMLHGQTLALEEASKYLGVTLTSNLSWNKHVENVAAKGNRTLGFVKRNLRECTKPVKAASYTTLVRPVLEYASTIWDPTTDHNIKILDQVQKRAARFVTNDYTTRTPGCVTRMQGELGWDTLQKRRLDSRLSMLYRIDHQLVDVKKETYLQSGDSRTRGSHKFYQERITSEVYRNSFFPRTVRDWNRLPHTVTAAETLEEFRGSLRASTTNH